MKYGGEDTARVSQPPSACDPARPFLDAFTSTAAAHERMELPVPSGTSAHVTCYSYFSTHKLRHRAFFARDRKSVV